MPSYRIQVLDRALAVLDALAEEGALLGVSELTSRIGLSKSTTHRLLMALEGHRLVQQYPPHGKFGLGLRLVELGARAGDYLGLIQAARGPVAELSAATGETAHLAVLADGEVLSIYAVEGPRTLRTPSTVGRRTPVHPSSLGTALLAHMPRERADELLHARGAPRLERFTPNTIGDMASLRRELDHVRALGYAVDDEEYEQGLSCIGAAVLDGAGRPVAAVGIAGPANRLRNPESGGLAEPVRQAAAKISAALSWRGGDETRESEPRDPFAATAPATTNRLLGGNSHGDRKE